MTVANIPAFRVTLDGTDLTAKLRPRLISLSISEKRGDEADQLDLVLDDADGLLALPRTGARLSVAIGWRQGSDVSPGLVDKGTFVVDEIEHSGPPDAVVIRARAADFAGALKVRREKGWTNTTIGAIVTDIAGRHGLTPHVDASLADTVVEAKAQSRESDLAFVRRLGREHDAVATIKAGALILAPIGAGVTATGTPLAALTIRRRDGDRHSYRIEKREEAEGVTASWHDRKGAKRHDVTEGKPDGARRLSRTYATEAEARTAARAAKASAARQPVSLSLTLALGRADLYPEQKATLVGYKAAINGMNWLVAESRHTIGASGYSTSLSLERG